MSETVSNLIEEVGTGGPIPLPNVTGNILAKIVTYCRHHVNDPVPVDVDPEEAKRTDNISPWDLEFCDVDQPTLFELILAANYLDIRPLLEVTCKTVANMIKNQTPEEIRKTFNITTTLTPEEEELIRKENDWAAPDDEK